MFKHPSPDWLTILSWSKFLNIGHKLKFSYPSHDQPDFFGQSFQILAKNWCFHMAHLTDLNFWPIFLNIGKKKLFWNPSPEWLKFGQSFHILAKTRCFHAPHPTDLTFVAKFFKYWPKTEIFTPLTSLTWVMWPNFLSLGPKQMLSHPSPHWHDFLGQIFQVLAKNWFFNTPHLTDPNFLAKVFKYWPKTDVFTPITWLTWLLWPNFSSIGQKQMFSHHSPDWPDIFGQSFHILAKIGYFHTPHWTELTFFAKLF